MGGCVFFFFLERTHGKDLQSVAPLVKSMTRVCSLPKRERSAQYRVDKCFPSLVMRKKSKILPATV